MIVVTAPTGAIGSRLVPDLLDRGAPVRVIVRDPARLPAAVRDRVEVVTGSHADPDVVAAAFAGADAVFWLVPPDPRAASIEAAYAGFSRPAVAALADHGVARVVGISALGRGTPVAGHAGHVTATLALDDLIAATGVAYRALALPSFMDNVLRSVPAIRDRGVFAGPLPADRPYPAVATRDAAAVAARLLLDDSWTGVDRLPLLGPADLTHAEMAQVMTEVLGRPVRYERTPLPDLRAQLLTYGSSAAVAEAVVDMMAAKEAGLDGADARTAETATPTTFRRWCEEELRPAVLGR